MLGVLVHSLVPSEAMLDSNRTYGTVVKKVRKDIGERRSEALDEVKRFLPLQRASSDIYIVEQFDGTNNRLLSTEMKKHGLQVARKVSHSFDSAQKCLSWLLFTLFKGKNQQLGHD